MGSLPWRTNCVDQTYALYCDKTKVAGLSGANILDFGLPLDLHLKLHIRSSYLCPAFGLEHPIVSALVLQMLDLPNTALSVFPSEQFSKYASPSNFAC
jgi:hypothetical protein